MIKSLLQKPDEDDKVITGIEPVLTMDNPEVNAMQEEQSVPEAPVVNAQAPVTAPEEPMITEEPVEPSAPVVAEAPVEPSVPMITEEPVEPQLTPAEQENALGAGMDRKTLAKEMKRRIALLDERQDTLIAQRKEEEDLKFSLELESLLEQDPTRSTADEEYASLSVQAPLTVLEAVEVIPAMASISVMIMRSIEDKVVGTESNYTDQIISFLGILNIGAPLEGSKIAADRIIKQENYDSIFDISKQQELEAKYGVKVSKEILENTAIVRGVVTTVATLNASSLVKLGTKKLSEVGVGTFKESAEGTIKDALKTQTKASIVTAGSIKATQEIVGAIDPQSTEDAFLLSMITGVTSGIVLTPTINVASSFIGYTPTAILLKGGKKGTQAIMNGTAFVADGLKMKAEAERRGMKLSEVADEWYEKSEGSSYMTDFLNRIKDDPESARAEVEKTLQAARENPGGVEHQAATALYKKMSEDGINIEKATNLAASLTESLQGTGLTISAFDTYNGIFKDNFIELYNNIDPQAHLKRWESQLELLQKSLEIEEFASPDDVRNITNAATVMTNRITAIKKEIDDAQSLALQENVSGLVDTLLSKVGVSLKGNQDDKVTASYNKLRGNMKKAKKAGQAVVNAMYSAVDPKGVLKTNKALSGLNDMMNATVRTSGDYKVSKDLYNTSLFSYLENVLDNPNGVIPELINRDKQPVQDPNSMFNTNTLDNTEGRVVFMSVNQFQKLTKALDDNEGAAASALSETPDTKFSNVPGLSLDMVDGVLSITGSLGRAEAQAASLISSKSKGNTLIPVELKTSDAVNVETLIKTGAIDIRGEGNNTQGNFDKVRLKGQIEEQALSARIKRAEVEALADYARTNGFEEQGGLSKSEGVLKLDNMELSYRQAREIQKNLRTKARNTSDPILKQALDDKAAQFDLVMDQLVASDTQASLAFRTAQDMYKDFYVPDFLNTTQGIIGKFNSLSKDGVDSQLLSITYGEVLNSPELRAQLAGLTEPQKFSMFNELVSTPEGKGKLAYLNDLLTKGTKEQLARLPQNGAELRTLVSGILLDDILTTYRKRSSESSAQNAGELLYSVVNSKMSNPLFKTLVAADPELSALFEQLQNTAIEPYAYLPSIAALQNKASQYDNVFYNNIENLRKGNTVSAILNIIKDPEQLTLAVANMVSQGNALAGSREFMISTVYREGLKWKDGVLDVKQLERTLETYGKGLDDLSGSTKDRRNLEIILETTKAIGDRPNVKASLDLKRFKGFIGTILEEGPPAVSNYFHAQKMGLNTGYIAAARSAAFAKKRIKAMEHEFTQLTTSIAIETMLNPALFKELKAISELKKNAPPELVKKEWDLFEVKLRSIGTEGAKQAANSLRIIKNLSETSNQEELNSLLEELQSTEDPEQEEKEIKESFGIYDMDEFKELMDEGEEENPVEAEEPNNTSMDSVVRVAVKDIERSMRRRTKGTAKETLQVQRDASIRRGAIDLQAVIKDKTREEGKKEIELRANVGQRHLSHVTEMIDKAFDIKEVGLQEAAPESSRPSPKDKSGSDVDSDVVLRKDAEKLMWLIQDSTKAEVLTLLESMEDKGEPKELKKLYGREASTEANLEEETSTPLTNTDRLKKVIDLAFRIKEIETNTEEQSLDYSDYADGTYEDSEGNRVKVRNGEAVK